MISSYECGIEMPNLLCPVCGQLIIFKQEPMSVLTEAPSVKYQPPKIICPTCKVSLRPVVPSGGHE
jgi:hypothetical protein